MAILLALTIGVMLVGLPVGLMHDAVILEWFGRLAPTTQNYAIGLITTLIGAAVFGMLVAGCRSTFGKSPNNPSF